MCSMIELDKVVILTSLLSASHPQLFPQLSEGPSHVYAFCFVCVLRFSKIIMKLLFPKNSKDNVEPGNTSSSGPQLGQAHNLWYHLEEHFF